MGRYLRPYLPGAVFHLTARTQHRAWLFTPSLKGQIVRLLRRCVVRCDTQLLAYVVMDNHLHLVVLQGRDPLESLMQPFLRSVALATHTEHGTEGHVFERRFQERVCRDDEHIRNAIGYTHANPVRAGMCADPGEYIWSSHRAYAVGIGTRRQPPVEVARGLGSFVLPGIGPTADPRSTYLEYVAGLLDAEAGPADGSADSDGLSTTRKSTRNPGQPALDRPSLAEIVQAVGASRGVHVSPDVLKSRWGHRSRLAFRTDVALAARREGYTGREIAGLLDVSEPTVSRMLAAARTGSPDDIPVMRSV